MKKLKKTVQLCGVVALTLVVYGFVGWYLWQSAKLWP